MGKSISNGYPMIYYPQHHRAKQNGYTYEHVLVMEKEMGRPLKKGEEVHHLDGNRRNNRRSNLIVLWKRHHGRLHKFQEKKKGSPEKEVYCLQCGVVLEGKGCDKYCSLLCARLSSRRVKRPPLDQLVAEIKEWGYVGVGKKYGVSDNAIRKWLKSY